jgi:Prefoldin subunit
MEVDIMVPVVNNKALFPGKLYHTGEVTISHGNQMYSSCTTSQALKICGHRLKAAKERIAQLEEEKDLLTNKIELPFDESAFARPNEEEIIEVYDEEQEVLWREKHRANVRKMKMQEAESRSDEKKSANDVLDVLDELEMIEELENELEKLEENVESEVIEKLMSADSQTQEKPRKSHLSKEGEVLFAVAKSNVKKAVEVKPEKSYDDLELGNEYVDRSEIIALEDLTKASNITKKIEIFSSRLKQVNQEIESLRSASETTEQNLLRRADLEELKDFLEDQLDQLQSDSEGDCPDPVVPTVDNRRRSSVTFAANDSVHIMDNTEKPNELLSQKTLKLKITHSANVPDDHATTPTGVIRSPSDIYKEFAHCLAGNRNKSILKNKEKVQEETINRKPSDQQEYRQMSKRAKQMEINEAVAFGEVVERVVEQEKTASNAPKSGKMSRFKQSRRK